MKVVIYARYSTDKQSESSIDDQIRLCKVRVEYEGWKLISTFHDEGVSGSTPVAQRVGGVRLLSDAMAGKFDVLVLEGLDRLSRDLVEQEIVVRRLEHRGIRILGLSDGYDTHQDGRQLVRGMRGLINEMYLEDLKKKTHRGMSGQVARGFAAGGPSYGYINVKGDSGSIIKVDEEAAHWVRWIFERCAEGWAFKRIVQELNRLKVRSPRGSSWGISAVYGSPAKGTGILNNELYIGRYIWNRSKWVKDPDTGKRQRLERPESEWMVEDVSHLRIVDQVLWEKVRARFEASRLKGGIKGRGKRVSTLLGGLLTCAKCGGTITAVSSHSYGCSNNKYRGEQVCTGVNLSKKRAESQLLSLVGEILLEPELIDYVYREIVKALSEGDTNHSKQQKEFRKRIRLLEDEIDKYVEAIGKIGVSESLAKKLRDAEFEKKEIASQLKSEQVKFELPDKEYVEAHYRKAVNNLDNVLREDIEIARANIKDILGCVRIGKEGDDVYAEFEADSAVLLKTAGLSPGMVAGAGFEPTTFGL